MGETPEAVAAAINGLDRGAIDAYKRAAEAGNGFLMDRGYTVVWSGWQGDIAIDRFLLPLAGTYFNQRKTTIYGGSNEVQRNIVAQTVLGS